MFNECLLCVGTMQLLYVKLSYYNLTTVPGNRYNHHFTEKVKCFYILEEIMFSKETWLVRVKKWK